MLLVARKNLLAERTRLGISAGGVALSVLLITLLLSLYRGWDERVGGFLEKTDVDIWIAREGTTDFLSAASILPLEGAGTLSTFPEVERWSPLIVRPMSASKGNKDMDIHLVGYDPEIGMGGPLKIEEGKGVPGTDEVIVDEALSRRFGVNIGDTLDASDRSLKVVGKASGGDFVVSQIVFVTLDTAASMLKQEGFVTFYLLRLKEPDQADRFAETLERIQPDILALSGREFATATRERILGDILPILTVLLVLAFIVGLAVCGLTIYAATVEKSREYGILKAVGFSNGYLYRVVFQQSLVTGLLGFIIGVGLTLLAGPFAQNLVAQFVILVRWQDLLGVAAVTLLMALIAAYIPVRHLSQIDPVSVFKA